MLIYFKYSSFIPLSTVWLYSVLGISFMLLVQALAIVSNLISFVSCKVRGVHGRDFGRDFLSPFVGID